MAKRGKQDKDTLKVKEEIFVQELIKDKSQREAYKIAFPHSQKWKDNTIDVKACNLFCENKIQIRYKEIKERLKKESEEECIIDAKEILREYKKIAFANIKDFLSYRSHEIHNSKGDLVDIKQIIDMKDSEEVEGAAIQEVSINQKGTFTFKLHDKLKALNKLAEYVRLIKPEGEEEEEKDDGLTKQLEKLVNNGIWEGFEDDDDSEED